MSRQNISWVDKKDRRQDGSSEMEGGAITVSADVELMKKLIFNLTVLTSGRQINRIIV